MGLGSACWPPLAYLATIKCRETDSPVGLSTYFHLIATPIMGTWSAAVWHPMTACQWGMALGIGGLSLLAQVAMTKALHLEDAARVMPFKYFGAILALRLAWFLSMKKSPGGPWSASAMVLAAVTANTIAGNRKRQWQRTVTRRVCPMSRLRDPSEPLESDKLPAREPAVETAI